MTYSCMTTPWVGETGCAQATGAPPSRHPPHCRTSAVRMPYFAHKRSRRPYDRPMTAELIGRGAERRRLRELAAAAQRGSGALVVLCGEAGVGKTRLVQSLAPDMLVLRGAAAQGR